ncbi:MAG: zinc ribbon domain-containing protein [Blastocatellia bacterium]|nr:zinc ribbon domain-containing protein [Blastocatellia bacterium]
MFCPYCGFEYTQKTNYCKRCGENLGGGAEQAPAAGLGPRLGMLATMIMFGAVGIFTLIGLGISFAIYDNMALRGLHGSELKLPFMMGITLTGAVAGLLIWQLSRLISGQQKAGQNAVIERHFIREIPGATPEQLPPAVERPSVAEHTTRQMAKVYKDRT